MAIKLGSIHAIGSVFTIRLEFKPEDLWIGAFWRKGEYDFLPSLREYHLWVCLLPCFPLHVRWSRHEDA